MRCTPLLVRGQQPQGLKVPAPQLSHGRDGLGSQSDVDRFRVHFRHRPLVEGLANREPLHFGDELCVRLPIGRAHPHVGAAAEARLPEEMRSRSARVDAYGQQLSVPILQDLYVRKNPGLNRVADQADGPLLQIHGVRNPAYVPRPVGHSDYHRAAGGVGELSLIPI